MFERWAFASQLSIPLRIEERTVGLIDLFDVRARDYAEHLDFARSVGQIVAGAFDNALLLDRLEESNRSLRLLADSGLEFGASLDLEKVLSTVARRMCVAGGADTCDIFAVDGDVLRGLVSVDGDVLDEQFPGTVYRLEDFWTAREVVRLGAPVSVPDIVGDERLTPYERQENLGFGYRALVEFPLITPSAVVGVACLYAKRPGEFVQSDLLRGLGQIAAQAMANAALYRDLDKNAERLQLVTESSIEFSSSLDLERDPHLHGPPPRRHHRHLLLRHLQASRCLQSRMRGQHPRRRDRRGLAAERFPTSTTGPSPSSLSRRASRS